MKTNPNARMNGIQIYCLLITFLCVISVNAQNHKIWIGENLTEIVLENGKWYYQRENWSNEIAEVDSKYFVIDEISQELRYKIGFEELNSELDTIKLYRGFKIQLFINPRLLVKNNFKFYSFEFDILGMFGTVKTKYHLNKFGIFRKSNHKNETLIEKVIPDETLKEFDKLIQKIDIKNMGKAHGMRNNCDNLEYSFTFWDSNGISYNFTAMMIRKQLAPLKDFIMKLEK